MLIGTQGYVWYQIYTDQRGLPLNAHLHEILPQVAAAGCDCWEQGIESPDHARTLKDLLPAHGLSMPSMYAGATLHDDAWPAGVQHVLTKARLGQPLGCRTVVCNPNPIAWGKPLDKSDDQLKTQSHAFQLLAGLLKREGLTLAYHTHDPEMRHAGRELHHMMRHTDAAFCLDTHWIYRDAGHDHAALEQIISTYYPRLHSLHLRQSQKHVWSETFGDGDIDYPRLAPLLLAAPNLTGPIILEQCFEPGTPQAMPPLDRHRESVAYVRKVFAATR